MIYLRDTVQKSLAFVHKDMAMHKIVSLRIDIKSILGFMFEFMFFKMIERHFEPD